MGRGYVLKLEEVGEVTEELEVRLKLLLPGMCPVGVDWASLLTSVPAMGH